VAVAAALDDMELEELEDLVEEEMVELRCLLDQALLDLMQAVLLVAPAAELVLQHPRQLQDHKLVEMAAPVSSSSNINKHMMLLPLGPFKEQEHGFVQMALVR